MSAIQAIEQTESRFKEIAPNYLKFDAERGFALQLLNNNNYLAQAAATDNYRYFQQAITNVAAIGLSLNPAEKLAYLIPRNVKTKNPQGRDVYQTRVYLEPSYMGLIRLATDSGSIKWVQAYCVYLNDEFFDNGAGEKPTHKYNAFAKKETRGEFVGVYCVAKTADGDYLTTIMPAEDVYSVRDRSEAYKSFLNNRGNGGPWVSDFEEQAKKTVIRRAFKTWPRTDERRMAMLAHAVELSNSNEGFEPILSSPSLGQYTGDQKEHFDGLIERSDAIGMHVFRKTIDESTYTNLYHSFEKGQKGKYQKLIDELDKKGQDIIMSMGLDVDSATQSNDESAIQEIISELSSDELSVLDQVISNDSRAFIREIGAKHG